ncbi:chitinase-3-like protein 1 [Halyomorpha halys]|uniref:chitinase-3-like protein 1 n=1 Tax=Halyomorpha halys TaxID=286706 RepID=UPI0006D4F363|nr:chitinase-3-like protein 1 [Halyomorpha halys]XP_014276735.1 chitinase-3-like protein 1 [Halyomorpha halys]XP_014276743.1 chitinase-3-like protein 1 [Halyomorpha halys]
MYRIDEIYQFLILTALLAVCISQNIEDKKVVCYYTSWSVYRTNQFVFKPTQINPFLCTHLIYAFGAFDKDDGVKPFDEYQDITKGGYRDVTNIKTFNNELKVLLGLGGWREGSKNFSPIAASPDRRTSFSKNLLQYLRTHNFDGVNLDWQFPSFRDGSQPEDLENYVELVKALNEEFSNEEVPSDKSKLIISITVPSKVEYIEKGFDLEKLQMFCDFINIAAYDYHFAYEPVVNHHAALYPLPEETGDHPNAELNVDFTIKYIVGKGATLEKYILGIPVYGRSFKLKNATINNLGAPAKAQGTRQSGLRAYYDICKNVMNDKKWIVNYPNTMAMGPYTHKGEEWVGYDDEEISRRKAEFSVENGMSGIMFWTLDNDDFLGECSSRNYPIIQAGREGLEKALIARNNSITTTPVPVVIEEVAVIVNETGTPANGSEREQKSLFNISDVTINNITEFNRVIELEDPSDGTVKGYLNRIALSKQIVSELATLKPDFNLELASKSNGSVYYTIKLWIINNIFNF